MAFGVAAILAAFSLPAAAANLVTNGSFETNFGAGQFNQTLPGSSGGQSASRPGTTASGWTVTGTSPVSSAGYAFVFQNTDTFTTTNGHVGPTSGTANPEGFNTLPLWGNSSDASPLGSDFYGVDSTYHPSDLTQVIGGLVDGHTYTLTFDYAAAQQFGYSGNTTDQWTVMLGGQTIATTNIHLPSESFSGWLTDTVTFTYEGTGGLLSFAATGAGNCNSTYTHCDPADPSASGGPPFALLDGVSLTASAPEPSTWAMMIIGFAGLGYAGFRNHKRSAISALA
jgi:hypothetical protein